MAKIYFSELYCRHCRMSYSAIERMCADGDLVLPTCRGGGVHVFTDELPLENKLATVPAHGTVQ